MSDRDSWARLTPYEIGIPGREFADRNFQAIAREAEARGADPRDPGAFLMLGEVGRVLREIQGEEDRGGEALQRFGAFLFHAFHFHRAGESMLFVETGAARYLVEGAPNPEEWAGELPRDAGYLQLPRHLFWSAPGTASGVEPDAPAAREGKGGRARAGSDPDHAGLAAGPGGTHGTTDPPGPSPGNQAGGSGDQSGSSDDPGGGSAGPDGGSGGPDGGSGDPSGPAEPVDGIFWARSAGETLSLLVALGVRGDRPGISVVSLPPVPLADARGWLTASVRDEGEDFRTTLPGGELDGLYSIVTLGEALKLTARALAYVHTVPESLGDEERSPPAGEVVGEAGGGGPIPSLLPFRRVRLVGGAAE